MDEKKLGLALTEDIVYVCDRKACENCSEECNHTSDIHHAKNFTEIEPGKFMENASDLKCIYLITVFSKCEPDKRWGYNLGSTRSVGWRPTFEMAEETVKTNMCDIWEYCYDYACIEELNFALYPDVHDRRFYKFNEETGHYEEMDEPAFIQKYCPIGGIG